MNDRADDPDFDRGVTAYIDGAPHDDNPHGDDTYAYTTWSMGWQTARARREAVLPQ